MKDITVEKYEIEINGNQYGILHDPITDDWQVTHNQQHIDSKANHLGWFLEKTDAVEYVLEHGGVVDDGYYERAPERC
jgi:hypothetical protein